MVRRIHRETILLAGWGRAILLQLAHPLIARGVADHSPFRSERWGRVRRLDRTLRAMLALTFGTPEAVERTAAGINAVHRRVHGTLPEAAGRFPAGTRYSARDPELLRWVHATLLDSFLLTYERFVGPLTPAERDRYCLESAESEVRLGMPAGWLPRSVAANQAYLEGMLVRGDIAVTDTARMLAREVVSPAVPWPARPVFALVRLTTLWLLPPGIRRDYGYEWSTGRERAMAGLAALVRAGLPLLPSALRHWRGVRS
jgi:uncharacterized protein (DUF2236 family)